jgi:hypothetical protein
MRQRTGKLAFDPLAEQIRLEQEQEFRRELRLLSDVAFSFLCATNGVVDEAVHLLDQFVSLICEGNVLSTWRYRILLEMVREGL